MRRKAIATSKSELADVLNKMDGLRTGLSRADARKALKHMEVLETALILKGYRSAAMIIRRKAVKKAKAFKAKKKAQ